MRLALTTIAALLAASGLAGADDEAEKASFRIVIDRIDLEPATIGGQRLRVFLSALSLQGQRLDLTDPRTIKTFAGTSEIKAPVALGTFGTLDIDTAIVVVVQATVEYADVLPVIADALDQQVFAALPEARTQVALLPYGETIGSAKLQSLKQARGKLEALESDGSASQPALLDTIERALLVLKKAKSEPEGRAIRKLILVIGDGRDVSDERERVTRLALRAAKEGVRIHSFAFSPTDVRRPLLLLGELSKRSLGTFRWIRSGAATSWGPPFEQLRDEITSQYVITYFADTDVAGKRLHVETSGRAVSTSNEVKVPALACAGAPCDVGYCTGTRCVVARAEEGRGVLGWILLIGGIGIGAIVALGVVGWLITRRQQATTAASAGMPSATPPVHGTPSGHAPHGPPGAVVAPAPVAVAGPRLYIMSGPRAGEQVALRHGFTIGKQPGCDLVIDDGYTSGQHAQIGMDHFGHCRLYDQGSTNGTFVNGVRVTEHVLDHGTTLRIGSTELRFLAQ